MIVIGVTGGVGTGKSTVSAMFGKLGAAVIDADALAREVIAPRGPAWRTIVRAFGRDILRQADGTIDRSKLAGRVFADARLRHHLERIVHPRVLRRMASELKAHRLAGRLPAVVLDVPLLFESKADRLADVVVVVTAPRAVAARRLRLKRGWSQKEVQQRNAAQWALSAKVALADYVVKNTGGVVATRTQVKRLWRMLVKPHRRLSRRPS
jgi:dephospho-CoA kinase